MLVPRAQHQKPDHYHQDGEQDQQMVRVEGFSYRRAKERAGRSDRGKNYCANPADMPGASVCEFRRNPAGDSDLKSATVPI